MSIFLMRALVCVLSVTMPTCGPVKLTACSPSSWIGHRHQRDGDLLAGGQEHVHLAGGGLLGDLGGHAIRSSVVLPWALTTTMTWLPACLARMALRAASMIRSAS